MHTRRPGMRVGAFVLVLIAVLLIACGERWVLEQPADAANELTAAMYVLDAVYGPATSVGLQSNVRNSDERVQSQ